MQALNAYDGAVVIVSHDRHMIELVADRLVLVDGGRAEEFGGSLDDYTDMILGKNQPKGPEPVKSNKKEDRKAAAAAREQSKTLRAEIARAEKEMDSLTAHRSRIERAMFDPDTAGPEERNLTMTDLMVRRADIEKKLAAAESCWLEASAALDGVSA